MTAARITGFIIFFWPTLLFSQRQDLKNNYVPTPMIDTIPSDVLRHLKSASERAVSNFNDEDRRVNRYAKELYQHVHKSEIKFFNSDVASTNPELTRYVRQIVDRVSSAAALRDTLLVFVDGDPTVNAFSSGDGIIACNTGLIARLENTDQLAFILCHELAHYYLKHVARRIIHYARMNYDDNIRDDIKAIKKTNSQTHALTKALLENLTMSLTRFSRDNELQADSLGLVLCRKAGFNPAEAIRVMEILDSADIAKNRTPIDFKKHFDFKDYPFKKQWLEQEKGTKLYRPKDEIRDTVRTHPDCHRRIAAIRSLLNGVSLNRSSADDDGVYFSVLSGFEQIESEFHLKKYGKSLFETLLMLEKYPDNIYLHSMVGRNFYAIIKSQQNHTFGKTVDLPDSRFAENYGQFIAFVQKLRTSEIAAITNQYMTSRSEAYFDDEHFLLAFWEVSHLPGSVLDPELVKNDYRKKFPNGKYLNQLK